MYITAPARLPGKSPLLSCMSERIQQLLNHIDFTALEEVRLRRGRPLLLDFGTQQQFVTPAGRLCPDFCGCGML